MKIFFTLVSAFLLLNGLLYILAPAWKKKFVEKTFINVSDNLIRLYGIIFIVVSALLLAFIWS